MMDEQVMKHGAFSWCELLTSDVAAAKAFYGKLFGWVTEDMPEMNYTVINVAGKGMGGIMATPSEAKGMPPAWGAYVTVDDVDTTARLAVELGGKVVVEPMDIPKVGRFCVIQDPQGAVISAITYRM